MCIRYWSHTHTHTHADTHARRHVHTHTHAHTHTRRHPDTHTLMDGVYQHLLDSVHTTTSSGQYILQKTACVSLDLAGCFEGNIQIDICEKYDPMNTMHNGSRSIGLSVPLSFDTCTVSASSRVQLSVSRVGGEFSTSVSNSRNSFSAYLYSRKDESRNEWILQTDVRGRTKSCRKAMLGCPEWVVPCDHCMGGNVSFGPTSRGHPSAPKKRLRPSWLAGTRLFSVLSAERTSIPAPVTNVLRGYLSPSPPPYGYGWHPTVLLGSRCRPLLSGSNNVRALPTSLLHGPNFHLLQETMRIFKCNVTNMFGPYGGPPGFSKP